MSKPVFRNDDKLQRLPFRDWLRIQMPEGCDGYVVEDLDLVLRGFGKRFLTDSIGRFALVELKYGKAWIGKAQEKTFGLMHRLLRSADPEKKRYIGFFVVQYTNDDWDKSTFSVNKTPMELSEFKQFLGLDQEIVEKVGSVFDGPLPRKQA